MLVTELNPSIWAMWQIVGRSHMQRKLEVSLRLRGFVAVGESVPRYLSEPGLRKSAAHCAGADSRHQYGSHHSDH